MKWNRVDALRAKALRSNILGRYQRGLWTFEVISSRHFAAGCDDEPVQRSVIGWILF
jgi:hypothetical protein